MDCTTENAFDLTNWRLVPAIENRVATPNDVDNCLAIFATDPGSTTAVATPGLPALAKLLSAQGVETDVVVVQIEKQISGELTIVGYILPTGDSGAGTLPEFRFLEFAK